VRNTRVAGRREKGVGVCGGGLMMVGVVLTMKFAVMIMVKVVVGC
jgi:hypothetical protein